MSNHKLNIVFYVSGMPFNGDSLKQQSLGGSETAGLCMARELGKRGHSVTVFSNTDKVGKFEGGVKYRKCADFMAHMAYSPVDICIGQRDPSIFTNRYNSKINILWMHDIALKRNRSAFRSVLWNVDEIMGVSMFHVEQMAKIYGLPVEKFWPTTNGIDKINYKERERHPKRLMYTARPERGMDILLNDIMPKIWKIDPDVELALAGYDNTVQAMIPFYNSIKAKIKEYVDQGRKVEFLGHLKKEELYKEYQKSTAYVYPTKFEEVSCITMMECMGNGLPMIISKKAALPETVPSDCAVFIEGDAKNEVYQESFVKAVMELLNNTNQQNELRSAGLSHSKGLLWSQVAEKWENHFYDMFNDRTENKDALARHFYRTENIVALNHMVKNSVFNNDMTHFYWKEKMKSHYPQFDWLDYTSELHIEQGENYAKQFKDKLPELKVDLRIKTVLKQIGKAVSILDYGGAIGNEACLFVNETNAKVTSVNVSPHEIEVGKRLAKERCKDPDKITFVEANSPEAVEGMFDVVFAGEILEHIKDPHIFIDQLEAKCMEGGKMVFTVPLGAWGDTKEPAEYRGHLWGFDRTDLYDLFGAKEDYNPLIVTGPLNQFNQELLGWVVITYKKNSKRSTGTIDLDRKLAIQAPRQTVSACLILGGPNDKKMLHRCLSSIYDVVDEIIICDTGIDDITREILAHYQHEGKITLIPNVGDPKEIGFDASRNAGLEHASCDWIFWIDSDEELLKTSNIFKYLKANTYNGYSVRQHHFSCDPPNAFRADVPVRFFRNNMGIKFCGLVHEHPELGMNEGVGPSAIMNDVELAHDGYLTEEVRKGRFVRNYKLMVKDREKYPDRLLGKFLMCRDWMHLVKYQLGRNGNQATSEVVEYCRKTIELYEEELLIKETVVQREGLEYYGEALRILGEGLDYEILVGAINPDPKLRTEEPIMTVRFRTPEMLTKFLSARVEAVSEPYTGDYV